MRDRVTKDDVRRAMDDCLSGVEGMPSLRGEIMMKARGEIKVKKKLSMGLVLALVLTLIAVGALAAAILSIQQMVEQEIVPITLQNDTDGNNDTFSNEELKRVVALAEENGITLTGRVIEALEGGQGYYEEETIMALAKSQFGPIPAGWTLEQQKWFDDVMVEIGFLEINYRCVPKEGEMTFDEAVDIAVKRILKDYGQDVTEQGRFSRYVTYMMGVDDAGALTPPTWYIDFEANTPKDGTFFIAIDTKGVIESLEAINIGEPRTAEEVYGRYESAYGGEYDWTPDIWAAFGRDIKGLEPGAKRCNYFLAANYILPPEGAIALEEAQDIALKAVNLEYTTAAGAVCCMDGDAPIWKITTRTLRPEDIGTGRYTAMWLVEIDCTTGAIRDVYEYDTKDGNMTHMLRYLPRTVFERVREELALDKQDNG